jgi:hypothetical protein
VFENTTVGGTGVGVAVGVDVGVLVGVGVVGVLVGVGVVTGAVSGPCIPVPVRTSSMYMCPTVSGSVGVE